MTGLDAALQGLHSSLDSFNRAATRISLGTLAGPTQNPQDQISLSDEMVNLMQARNDYAANLQSLRTGDEMQRKLLDILG